MTSEISGRPRTVSPNRLPVALIAVFALLIAGTVGFGSFWLSHMRFNIPAGSMQPTLMIGDYLLVSRTSYGFNFETLMGRPSPMSARYFQSHPERGDVAVFRFPRDPSMYWIKRVIGLPGDTIAMDDGQLMINGVAVPKEAAPGPDGDARRFLESLPNGRVVEVLDAEIDGQFDTVGPFEVPEGHYFVLGDNRDNSTDSRALWGVGYVPADNFVGRASLIYFSHDNWRIRWDRIGRVPK